MNWKNECLVIDEECLTSSVETTFRNAVLKILLYNDYINDQIMLDFFLNKNLRQLKFENIQLLDEAMGQSILRTWSELNGGIQTMHNDPMIDSINWNSTTSLVNKPQTIEEICHLFQGIILL